jgi:hypothetical protein
MRVVSTALRRPLFLGILSAASVGRHRPCRLQIFPGDSPAAVAPPSGDFDGPNPPAVTGFWTIYDDVAMEDSMNRAARQEPEGPNSMMSASIVLRADGFTSRGSEFTRGTWQVEEQGDRRRLRITLEARALQEEIRYDGLLVKLDTAETGMAQVLAAALPKGAAAREEAIPQTELRVVGQASRYRVGGEGFEEGGEPELMKTTAFSMIKLEVHRTTLTLSPDPDPDPDPNPDLNPNPDQVDRTTLTPTIRAFCQPVDPIEVKRQQAEQRGLDVAETMELKAFLSDVRARKQTDPDNWQGSFNISKEAPVFGSKAALNATDPSSEDETSVRDLPEQ